MSESKPYSIPTAEEFARASRNMEERERGLADVRRHVIEHFRAALPLHDFYIMSQIDVDFRGYFFLETDCDLVAFKQSGLISTVTEYIYDQLDLAGRGRRPEITLDVEWDSHENVRKKYGSYYSRLL
jgi:hypothetical protein